jgi:hypothetical protein
MYRYSRDLSYWKATLEDKATLYPLFGNPIDASGYPADIDKVIEATRPAALINSALYCAEMSSIDSATCGPCIQCVNRKTQSAAVFLKFYVDDDAAMLESTISD